MSQLNNPKRVLYLLAAVNFMHIVDFMLLMPLSEALIRAFDIGPAAFSWLVSAYTLAAGLSGFLGAFWLDRVDKRKGLIITFTGFAIGTLLCAMSPSFWLLLISRALTGLFGGVTTALIISMASDIFPFQSRGYAMGVLSAAFSVASVAGVPFGLFLANMWSWQTPFYVLAVLCFAMLIPMLKWLPSFPKSTETLLHKPMAILSRLLSDQNQAFALLLGFLIVFGHFLIIPFITPFLVRNVQFPETSIPLMYMIGGGLTIFTAPLIGRFTDRIGAIKAMIILVLISFVPVLWLTHLNPVPAFIVLSVTSLFFIFASGRMIPAQTLITGAVKAEFRGSFMSFRSAVQQLATSTAAIFAGFLVHLEQGGRIIGFGTLGIVAVLVAGLALIPLRFVKVVG